MFTMEIKCILLYMAFNQVISQESTDVETLLNYCIDSKHHKTEPGPESSLYGQCIPWKEKSCCTPNATENLHLDPLSMYNFDYNHCSEVKPISAECLKHFTQDHCFYECSPNVGPWLVKENRSWRKERFYKVPLCASDCEVWFDACQEDYTCTDNWSSNFDWVPKECDKGTCKRNVCPKGAKCRTFRDIYRTAKNFCERVWDDAWEYTKDEDFCMRIWFNGSVGNPNDRVAEWKVNQLSMVSHASRNYIGLILIIAIAVLSSFCK